MNGITQRELSFLLLLWGLSDLRIGELRIMPQNFTIKLHSETQVSGRLGISGGRSPRHAQNPLSGERSKTLLITHHAISAPPSHHHLYIISSHQLTTTFLSYYMSHKRPFVPKSDVKQWFITTTTWIITSFSQVATSYVVSKFLYTNHLSSIQCYISLRNRKEYRSR